MEKNIEQLNSELDFARKIIERDKIKISELENELVFEKNNANEFAKKSDEYRNLNTKNRLILLNVIEKAEQLVNEYASVLNKFNLMVKLKGDDEMDFQTIYEFKELIHNI